MVVKLGGESLAAPGERAELWSALRDLHASHPGGLVVVHGGGQAVDEHLSRLGFSTERIEGLRVTPREQIGEVVAVLAGVVNKALVGAINHGAAPMAVGLCLGDGGLTSVSKLDHPAGDLGRVGTITGGDAAIVRTLLDGGFLPVIASIGIDAMGEPLNVNADDAAAGLASIVNASQLVLLTDVDGICDGNGCVIEQIDDAGIEKLIGAGVIEGGMIPKARGAARAAQRSGVATVIASWKRPSALATLASGTCVGTRVVVAGSGATALPEENRPGTDRLAERPHSTEIMR